MGSPTFLLAPDSFKESMTAKEVCMAMEKGLRRIYPDARYIHVPMADGGEGTVQSLVDASGGTLHTMEVTGPLGEPVTASFGLLGGAQTAVIEMASASGLHLVGIGARNPLLTTSYGTGELIRECLDLGVRRILIGIGGSATQDGGAGMAEALGVKFLDRHGREIARGGGALARLQRIDVSGLDPRLEQTEIIVACDVTHPLCGPQGSSAVFGPQKGATPETVAMLDANLSRYADRIEADLGRFVRDRPGSGAGLLAFTRCELRRGVDMVLEYTDFERKAAAADLVFTGEGGIDAQTKFGKTPCGVAQASKRVGKKVIAIAGYVGSGIEELYEEGIDAVFGIVPGAAQLSDLLASGPENVARTCENIARVLKFAD